MDIALRLQGSNGDLAPCEAPSTPEPGMNPCLERLTVSSKEGESAGSSPGPPTTEQIVRDTSPDLNMMYRNRQPVEEAKGKEKMWKPSVML